VIPCKWLVLTRVVHRWKNLRERGIALDGRRPVVSVLPVPANAEIDRQAIHRDRVLEVRVVVIVADVQIALPRNGRARYDSVSTAAIREIPVVLPREPTGAVARPGGGRERLRFQVSESRLQLVANRAGVEEIGDVPLDLTRRTRKLAVLV